METFINPAHRIKNPERFALPKPPIFAITLLGLPVAGCAPSEDKTQDSLKKPRVKIFFDHVILGQTFGHRKLDNDAKN